MFIVKKSSNLRKKLTPISTPKVEVAKKEEPVKEIKPEKVEKAVAPKKASKTEVQTPSEEKITE